MALIGELQTPYEGIHVESLGSLWGPAKELEDYSRNLNLVKRTTRCSFSELAPLS